MTRIMIREEEVSDHSIVYDIVKSAFNDDLQATLVTKLRVLSEPCISLVALLNDQLVGHIYFSPVTFESETNERACQLSPVSVSPEHQGKGVGSSLIKTGLGRCGALGWTSVFLVGNPNYYSRFGFTMAGQLGLSIGGPLNQYLQVIRLSGKALSGIRGQIYFHPAFDSI